MNTTEKLQAIRAKCVELLAIAEKRTYEQPRYQSWPDPPYANAREIQFLGFTMQGRVDDQQGENNFAFIASCAGHAEAGWRSTIALIDHIVRHDFTGGNIESAILSAWPDQLLSSK